MAIHYVFVQTVYINGYIYTADSSNTIHEAIAIHNGYILAIGTNEYIKNYIDHETEIVDLQGKTMLPGIIDSHIHPFWGGLQLSGCHLNYESLAIPETLERIQHHIHNDVLKGENDWLQVRSWLRQGMLPSGTDITRADLDTLHSKRPIILFSNDCHTLVANTRTLELFGLDKTTPEPSDGEIGRNFDGSLFSFH